MLTTKYIFLAKELPVAGLAVQKKVVDVPTVDLPAAYLDDTCLSASQ